MDRGASAHWHLSALTAAGGLGEQEAEAPLEAVWVQLVDGIRKLPNDHQQDVEREAGQRGCQASGRTEADEMCARVCVYVCIGEKEKRGNSKKIEFQNSPSGKIVRWLRTSCERQRGEKPRQRQPPPAKRQAVGVRQGVDLLGGLLLPGAAVGEFGDVRVVLEQPPDRFERHRARLRSQLQLRQRGSQQNGLPLSVVEAAA